MITPKRLYKYVVPERIDILKNEHIRFTQPSALNDPFELQPMFEEFINDQKLTEIMNIPFGLIEEALRNNYLTLAKEQKRKMTVDQVIQFAKANPQLLSKSMENIKSTLKYELSKFSPKAKEMLKKTIENQMGILSLSETIEHPLLWAHYSSAHRGFAIEFDASHSFFDRRRFEKDELYHLRKVRYVDRSSHERTLFDIDSDDLLATKAKTWSYEAEWRMLAPLDKADCVINQNNDNIYLFTIPSTAILGIVMGALISTSLYKEIHSIVQKPDNNHIKLKKATLISTNQSIQINEIQ